MSAEEVEGALADVVQQHHSLAPRHPTGQSSKASAPRTGAPSLFTAEAQRIGLSSTQIQSLVAALGNGPGRLREASPPKPSSGALPSRVAAHFPASAPASAAEADEWDEAEEDLHAAPPEPSAHLDLRDRMMLDAMELNRQALAQSQQLIEHMSRPKAPADPFGVLERSDATPVSEAAAGPGTRGFTRRAQWEDLLREPATSAAVASRVRSGLATSLNLPLSDLPATAMERYFTEVSPLADRPWLAYTAAISAALWRAREEQNSARVDLLISLLPLFLDQVARDGGRCQHAFLYTGLPEPAWGRIALNRGTPWDQPYSPLADHRWVAAQTAFMADVEAMDQRLRALGKSKGAGSPGADGSAETKAAAKAAAAEAKRLAKAASRQAERAAKAAEAKAAPRK
jgi:hypothetical protein